MKTNAREVYGYGAGLSTRSDRSAKVACMLLATCILGMAAGIILN